MALLRTLVLAAAASSAAARLSGSLRSRVSTVEYANPLIGDEDTPDPGCAWDPQTQKWWCATTGLFSDGAFLLHSSPDMATWTKEGVVFPTANLPKWAMTSGNLAFWAPELHFINNRWLVVFVGRASETGLLSIGIGVSSGGIAGPYKDAIGAPIIEDKSSPSPQGQIDATMFTDPSTNVLYLVWKEDGNADGKPTYIHYASLAADGMSLSPATQDWKATDLLSDTLPWERGVTEAPWVYQFNGTFFLFYSAAGYGGNPCYYSISVARSSSLLGPYEKRGFPILSGNGTTDTFQGPGHCSVVETADKGVAILYHAWEGTERTQRHLMMDRVLFESSSDGVWPYINDGKPSSGKQPVP